MNPHSTDEHAPDSQSGCASGTGGSSRHREDPWRFSYIRHVDGADHIRDIPWFFLGDAYETLDDKVKLMVFDLICF